MLCDFDAKDSRTRRFRNAGNSCYINATVQALFAVPPVQRLYAGAELSGHLSGGNTRADGRIDGDIGIANVYREARSATRKSQPMYPHFFWRDFTKGHKMMQAPSSNSSRIAIVALLRAWWDFSKAEIDRLASAVPVGNYEIWPALRTSRVYPYLCKLKGVL